MWQVWVTGCSLQCGITYRRTATQRHFYALYVWLPTAPVGFAQPTALASQMFFGSCVTMDTTNATFGNFSHKLDKN